MTDDRYTLNRSNDVLHRYPSFEKCNADDMSDRERIDTKTADSLLATDQARWCEHCRPDEGDAS